MSKEQTTDAVLAVVAARQRELLAAEKLKDDKTLERIQRRHAAFVATEIPALWEAVKPIQVLHPKAEFVYLQVPLSRWLTPIYANGLLVGLRARPCSWAPNSIVEWKCTTDKDGKITYYTRRYTHHIEQHKTAKELKNTFITWLADIIPVEEFAGLEISTLETPNVRRRVIKKIAHSVAN